MRGLILLLATAAMSCRAGYVGSSPYGNPLVHPQQLAPTYAPPAPVGEDGNVIDTPEVAQAKAAHFAEFARAAARAAQDEKQQQQQQQHQQVSGYNPQITSSTYSYPASHSTALPYLRQTNYQPPIYQTANHVPSPIYNTVNYQQPQQYSARANFVGQKSYALPAKTTTFMPAPLGEDGTVVDTPEVAALKATRLAELADAEARAYKHSGTHQYNPEEEQGQVYSGSPAGPVPINYNPSLGQYGASRAFPGPSYHGTQPYDTQQAAYGKSYSPSTAYKPQHYQSQHLTGAY